MHGATDNRLSQEGTVTCPVMRVREYSTSPTDFLYCIKFSPVTSMKGLVMLLPSPGRAERITIITGQLRSQQGPEQRVQ